MDEALLKDCEALLEKLLYPDTEVIRQAGSELNKRLAEPAAVPVFLHILLHHPRPELRQLSAVLLRMKIIGLWNKLSQELHKSLKASLLEALAKERTKSVSTSIADVVGIIARVSLSVGQWPELLDFLFQCTQSQEAHHREAGMKLFTSLTENVGEQLRQYFDKLHAIFANGLNDSELAVRVASLKAAGALLESVETEQQTSMYSQLVDSILVVLGQCLAHDLYDDCCTAFELLNDLIESEVPVMVPHIEKVTRAMLEIGANTNIDPGMRQMAMTVIQWVASYKSKPLIAHNLLEPCLKASFAMITEEQEQEEEDDEEDDDDEYGLYLTSQNFGCQMIDHFAIALAASRVLPPTMEFVKHLAQSKRAHDRKGAVKLLSVLAEGCSAIMAENIEPLLEFVHAGISDSSRQVREAACICLGQFATHLQPEVIAYHSTLLPLMLASLDDPKRKVRVKSCYALEAFVQHLGEDVVPHLPRLMEKLVTMLKEGDIETQEIVVTAISSVAEAAGNHMEPYYELTLQMMQRLMEQTGEEHMTLRARATECCGMLALAVGKSRFQLHEARVLMELACKGMTLGDNELREFTYGFFTNVAEVLGTDFLEFLPTTLNLALASCRSNEGVIFYQDESQVTIEGVEPDENSNKVQVNMPTVYLDEKSAACHAIGKLLKHTGGAAEALAFVPKALEILVEMSAFGYTDVRQNVMEALADVVEVVYKGTHPDRKWEAGVEDTVPLAQDCQQVLTVVLPIYSKAIVQDEDRAVAAAACEGFASIAKVMGTSLISVFRSQLQPAITQLLTKKAACQKRAIEEYEDEEAAEDRELSFLDSICDSLIAVAKVMGPLFIPTLNDLSPTIMKYLNRNADFAVLMTGLLAEVSVALGPAVAPFTKQLLPTAFNGISSDEPQLQRNCAFFCGVLCQAAGAAGDASTVYPQALKRLEPLFKSEDPNVVDNACGAIARMYAAAPSAVPMERYLPLLLSNLPLKSDFEENDAVYKAIFLLFQSNHKILSAEGVVPQCVNVFSKVLGTPQLKPQIQEGMVALVKALLQQFPDGMRAIAQALPAEQQQNLQKHLQQ
ncbi:HEAT repeat domain containing protein [Balamuthia mandrillaris]